MNKIELKVYAKINLGLDIVGLLPHGYHSLDTIMASVNIYDKITIEKSDKSQVIFSDNRQIKDNSAMRSLELCMKKFKTSGAKVIIEKHIPMAAGFGGSSADASGTLFAMSKLYDLDLNNVIKASLSIGSDVPFMIEGGIKRVRGEGGDIESLNLPSLNLVAAKGNQGVSTKDVYLAYDYFGDRVDINCIINFFKKQSNKKPTIFNALQTSAISLCPEIQNTIALLSKHSDVSFMTGSGSAALAFFNTQEEAICCDNLLSSLPFHMPLQTMSHGIEIISMK